MTTTSDSTAAGAESTSGTGPRAAGSAGVRKPAGAASVRDLVTVALTAVVSGGLTALGVGLVGRSEPTAVAVAVGLVVLITLTVLVTNIEPVHHFWLWGGGLSAAPIAVLAERLFVDGSSAATRTDGAPILAWVAVAVVALPRPPQVATSADEIGASRQAAGWTAASTATLGVAALLFGVMSDPLELVVRAVPLAWLTYLIVYRSTGRAFGRIGPVGPALVGGWAGLGSLAVVASVSADAPATGLAVGLVASAIAFVLIAGNAVESIRVVACVGLVGVAFAPIATGALTVMGLVAGGVAATIAAGTAGIERPDAPVRPARRRPSSDSVGAGAPSSPMATATPASFGVPSALLHVPLVDETQPCATDPDRTLDFEFDLWSKLGIEHGDDQPIDQPTLAAFAGGRDRPTTESSPVEQAERSETESASPTVRRPR